MNDRFELPHLPTRWTRRFGATCLDLGRRGIALSLIWLLVPLSMPASAQQQVPPPPPPDQQQGPPPGQQDQGPPPQAWTALSPDQLNELVAPIALYPDSLVAQVLAAATYPEQVADADHFVQDNQGVPPGQLAQMADGQPWDPSVKALTAFPSVLANMDRNLDWTTQLGNAYYNQPQDVMDAVQAMRQQAYQRGDLRTTPQEVVQYEPTGIVIAPANPDVVYVPYYDPWAVWGFRPWYAWYAPPRPPGLFFVGGLALGFGIGVVLTAWRPWGWGWGHWGFAWGPHPYVMYNHYTYVSRSVTVINRGHYGYFDRHPGAREFNRQYAHNYDAAYHRGQVAGYNHGFEQHQAAAYNRGQANGYNRGYNQGVRNTYRAPVARPENRQNYNRPTQNYNRPQQNYNRPAQNYNRPQQNYNRSQPQRQNRPQPQRQSRPSGNSRPHGNSKPHGNGGNHNHGGGDHGHHR
jgi:hypothetical protein